MTRKEAASCINTIVILKNLCYRVRGHMDVIDAQNCDKIIEMLNTVGETHKKHTETHACDMISRQAAIDGKISIQLTKNGVEIYSDEAVPVEYLKALPPAQSEYTELTPEEAGSEIASGSIMSASYWIDAMIRLKQMGYAICRKKG